MLSSHGAGCPKPWLHLAAWECHWPPARRLRGPGRHPGVGVGSLLQPCSCWGPQFWLGTGTPTLEGPGFPAIVLPRWCLGSAWSLCHSPWDTHCPSRVPKGGAVPPLPPFSWHLSAPSSVPRGPGAAWLLSWLCSPPRSVVPSPLCLRALPVGSPGRVGGTWTGRTVARGL